jgi:magnesium chelatase family protein
MLAQVNSGAVVGLDAVPVTVEVDIASQGLPSFTIVGLPDKAVEESRERVRAAIKNSGADFPAKRITVNLAPADLPKAGPAYDLPIALGILVASGQLNTIPNDAVFVGELSLDGSLRHTNGILPLAMMVKASGAGKQLYLPSLDAREAAIIRSVCVFGVPSLLGLFHHLSGSTVLAQEASVPFSDTLNASEAFESDIKDVQGQEQAKRALEIAAAGAHNLFMQGPPGAGKTMLARTIPSILPVLTEDEALEVTKIYSVTGNLPPGESVMKFRPFRAPHHTTSRIGLIGGGTHPQPGEISLAHRGVLFLDEFPEYPRHVLEALRQPIEDGIVTISRAVGSVQYPAKFILVAAANPCPCGNLGSEFKRCTCPPGVVSRYQKRISGPILDRIDLHIHVPAVSTEKLTDRSIQNETSKKVRKRVQKARNLQTERLRVYGLQANAEMSTRVVRECVQLSTECEQFLRQAVHRFRLSARGYYRVIKVARTIADLSDEQKIALPHVAEALQYRPTDENTNI